MKNVLFISPNKIRTGIIIILFLGLVSAIAAVPLNNQLKQVVYSFHPEADNSIIAISRLIQKGSSTASLQQELEKAAASNDKFGDLLVIDQNSNIVAALDPKAVGRAFPISFRSNLVKGIPLPFDYHKREFPESTDLYTIRETPDLTVRIFVKANPRTGICIISLVPTG